MIVVAAVLGVLLVVASSVSASTKSASPCAGVRYAPPPTGAPPAPPVSCSAGLVGIGNAGIPLDQVSPKMVKYGPMPDFSPSSTSNRGNTKRFSADDTSCADGLTYAGMGESVSPSDQSDVGNDSAAISRVAVTDTSGYEHSAVGIINWQNAYYDTWVQMGFTRGNNAYWTDTLDSDQVEVYLEFQTDTVYEWYPLEAETQGEGDRHALDLVADGTGNYYDLYLDNTLKWADIYMGHPLSEADISNEDNNDDGVCDPGFADDNSYTVDFYNTPSVDSGHALQTYPDYGPWYSGEITNDVADIPSGYSCGENGDGVYWWC